MKKYICTLKIALLEKLDGFYDLASDFIFFALIVTVLMNIWRYIYVGAEVLCGYTLQQIMWYALLAETVWFGSTNRKLSEEISYDIKSGNIACKITKPYNYVCLSFARYIGGIVIKLLVFIIISIILGFLLIGPIRSFNIISFPAIVLTYLLAVTITSALFMIISLSSFWLSDNKPIYWVYNQIIIMLGVKFPVEMLPNAVQFVYRLTPIFACTYGPLKLTVDFSFNFWFQMIVAQVFWLLVLILVIFIMYKEGLNKISSHGG